MAAPGGWSSLFSTAFKQSRNAMVLVDDGRLHMDVNGAYLKLLQYPRSEVIGTPISRFVAGGPLLSPDEWEAALGRGEFTGKVDMVSRDGTPVSVQWGAHVEVVTGRRLVLFVALSTSRWGAHFRRPIDPGLAAAALSGREREVTALVAAGHSGPEIADELHISHDTVRTHVRNAMAKLGARSRAHLVAKSIAEGHVLD
jgi:DNA-binding CsgD family transcriptional regulator